MDLQLKDEVVLITGASKGIGLACARAFVAEGARVALAARNAEVLHAAAVDLRASGAELVRMSGSGRAGPFVRAVLELLALPHR